MFFEFSPVRKEKKEKKLEKLPQTVEEIEVLSLAPFSALPKLTFDNVKVGDVVSRQLLIKNPTDQDVNLFLSKLVPEDLNVSYSWRNNIIESRGETIFKLTWCPSTEVSARHNISFTDEKNMKREISITFKTIIQKKVINRKKTAPPRQKTPTKPVTKKYYPVRPTRISPKKYSTPPKKNPMILVSSPAKYVGKENMSNNIPDKSRSRDVFSSPKNVSFTLNTLQTTARRETYVLKTSPAITFEDSLETVSPTTPPLSNLYSSKRTPLSDKSSLFGSQGKDDFAARLEKFIFLSPDTTSVVRKEPSDTVLLMNVSSETYVKEDVSGATFTKDSSLADLTSLNLSPCLTNSPKLRCSSPYNESDSVRKIMQTNLSRIEEESVFLSMPSQNDNAKRRRLDKDLSITSPKTPRTCSARNWSKKGGTGFRVSKKTSGLSVNTTGAILEMSKRDTSAVIIQNPFIIAATTSVDPFLTNNLYVNEEWMDQQELNLKKWLNALLAPPQELSSEEKGVIDVAKMWQECQRKEANEKVTHCDVVHTNNKLNSLRKTAQSLYRSPEMGLVLRKVMEAVDSEKLSIRADKDIHLNLMLKSKIIGLFLNYNSLWLRIALETIYNEIIPLGSNSDIMGLSKFIVDRVLKDPYLVRKYKSVHSPKYACEFKKCFLKKFLILVYFLDQAKTRKLIPHDPCLFRKNGSIKESKELLVILAREALFAVGDITKTLKFLGYTVSHVQTYIHEFDYSVSNLGIDLRDGVRLTKVMEIILLKNDLMKNLRVPAISRLQKVFNMKIVFSLLNEAGFQILYDISPKDIVDGHKEKTLSFLWQMIYKFEAPLMVQSATTIQRWFRSAPIVRKRRQLVMEWKKREDGARKIQTWYKRLKLSRALELYAKQWKQDRAAVKIQSYYRRHVCQKSYKIKLQVIVNVQRMCRGYLVRNVMTQQIRSVIVIQSHIRMFLARTRFLAIKRSVQVLQAKYRAQRAMKQQKSAYNKLKTAVVLIQQRFRANRLAAEQRQAYLRLRSAAILVQGKFRAKKLGQATYDNYVRTRSATVIIQTWLRSMRAMQVERKRYAQLKNSARVVEERYLALKAARIDRQNFMSVRKACTTIQQHYRAWISMRENRKRFRELRTAAVCIQQRYRANEAMKQEVVYYQKLRGATVFIQRTFRANACMKKERESFLAMRKASIKIQCWFRATTKKRECRSRYLSLKHAVLTTEAKFLMIRERRRFLKLKSAVTVLQRRFRAQMEMEACLKKFVLLKNSTVMVQRRFRANRSMVKARESYETLRKYTVFIQTAFRAKKLAQKQRNDYLSLKKAVIVVQRRFRAQKMMRKCLTEYVELREKTIKIQIMFKANKLMKKTRESYQTLRKYTVLIQSSFRANKQRNNYLSLRKAVIVVQRRFRAQKLMRKCLAEYLELREKTIKIQTMFRAHKLMEEARDSYRTLRLSTIFIQSMFKANRLARKQRNDYLNLQKAVIVVQRRYRAQKLMQKCSAEYVTLREKTMKIQTMFRAHKQMKEARESYRTLRLSTIFIQRAFRANRLARKQRNEYLNLQKSVIVVQRRYRAQKLMQKCSTEYVTLRENTIKIQTMFRANKLMKKTREYYQTLRNYTVFIQRVFRANKLAQIQRNNYSNLRKAVIVVQRRYRAQKMMQKCSTEYVTLREKTIKIQTMFRAYKLMKEAKTSYTSLRNAAIIIQQRWRAKRQSEEARSRFLSLKNAVVSIQQLWRAQKLMKKQLYIYQKTRQAAIRIQLFYRGYLEMRKVRDEYELKRKIIIRIQTQIRGFIVREKCAQYLSPEAKEQRRIEKQRQHAAVKIQAAWRGYKSRSLEPEDCARIRNRARKANAEAKPENTLALKFSVAVNVFASKTPTMFHLISALQDIDYVTRRCESYCIRLARLLPNQLYLILGATSRSLPEMTACIHAVNILINTSKFESTKKFSFVPEYLNNLVAVMLHWCDKESPLFPNLCTLFWIFSHDARWKRIILELPNFAQKMTRIDGLVSRKAGMVRRSTQKTVSYFLMPDELPMPSLLPDYGLDYKNNPYVFTNSVQGLTALLDILNN